MRNQPKHKPSTSYVEQGDLLRTRNLVSDSLDTLRSLVNLAAGVSGNTGVPGLSLGLSMLITILDKIQTMRTTVDGVGALLKRVETFVHAILQFCLCSRSQGLSEVMQKRIDNLVGTLVAIVKRTQEIKSRGPIARFFTSNADAKRLEGLIGEIRTSLDDFLILGILNVEENVDFVQQTVAAIDMRLDASFMPRYAKNAQYDANTVRRSCLEGTREEVLDYVDGWVQKCSEEIASASRSPGTITPSHVLWINGLAGTGKTTIACTIAEKHARRGTLGANFFCSGSDAECSDPNMVFVTISRQLCHHHEPFKEKVAEALREQPDNLTAGPLRQFEELILRPLQGCDGAFPTCIIILDALDECRDNGVLSTILSILARFIQHLTPFIFIITSRPEPRVAALFERSRKDTLKDVTASLVLHTVELGSVIRDIRLYLTYAFAESAAIFELEESWPSAQDIDTLVRLSHGLFIWAATAVRFIMDPAFGDPEGQIRALILQQTDSQMQGTILDSLYNQIAQAASSKISQLHVSHLQLLLGTIAVAREPLSSSALAGILGLPTNIVRNSLVGVRSVLHIPQNHGQPIHIIHPTFPEFLLASNVERPATFCIDATEYHSTLLARSLIVMSDLKQDIAGISDPLIFKTEIPTLSEDVKQVISQHLRYASLHWSAHLCGASTSSSVAGNTLAFGDFLRCQLLPWLEVCSLLGALSSALSALDEARRFCQGAGVHFVDLVPLLVDYHRFLLTFFPCIDTAPLQLYHSALAFAPLRSAVKRIYSRDTALQSIVSRGALQDWSTCLDCISGHGAGYHVYAVAFSSGGDSFVTGGGDGMVRVWNSLTRTLLLSVKACDGAVNDVAFSVNGCHVASAQDDSTIRLFEVETGKHTCVLAGHRSGAVSVEYSIADSNHILSSTRDGEVKLWNSADRECLFTLSLGKMNTCQVALSPNGGVIAAGTESALSLYDIFSATHETLPLPGCGRVAVFSPNGRYIAAATETELWVWLTADRSLLHSVTMPCLPFRLAFSGDSSQLGCGLRDGSIALWRIESEVKPRIVQAHTGRVFGIAWSPDGSQIVSASSDHTFRVWDTATLLSESISNTQILPPDSRIHPPGSQHLSPTPLSTILCEGSSINILDIPSLPEGGTLRMPDGAVKLTRHANIAAAWDAAISRPVRELYMDWCVRARDWEFLTGQRCLSLSWRPVSVSLEAWLIAYIPNTSISQVHVCDIRTGSMVAILSGHTAEVFALAFSVDGTLLATGSNDKTVKVWRVVTGDLVSSYVAHETFVRAVSFSSDARLIISGARDSPPRVHEVHTGRVIHILGSNCPGATIVKVAFSADDKYVVALDHTRHFSVWDAATGCGIYNVSLAREAWINTLDFPPNDNGIITRTTDGVSHTITMHNLYPRMWPVYHVSQDGWVTAKRPGVRARRMCWLPPGWREVFSLGGTQFCALDLDHRRAVIFDMCNNFI